MYDSALNNARFSCRHRSCTVRARKMNLLGIVRAWSLNPWRISFFFFFNQKMEYTSSLQSLPSTNISKEKCLDNVIPTASQPYTGTKQNSVDLQCMVLFMHSDHFRGNRDRNFSRGGFSLPVDIPLGVTNWSRFPHYIILNTVSVILAPTFGKGGGRGTGQWTCWKHGEIHTRHSAPWQTLFPLLKVWREVNKCSTWFCCHWPAQSTFTCLIFCRNTQMCCRQVTVLEASLQLLT